MVYVLGVGPASETGWRDVYGRAAIQRWAVWRLFSSLVKAPFRRTAAARTRTEALMDGTTIFVIVLVTLFLGSMIGFQVYIHTGKRKEGGEQGERRG